MDTPVPRWAFDQAEGELAIEKELHDLAGVAAVKRELDAGMFIKEGSEQTREDVLRNSGRGAKK